MIFQANSPRKKRCPSKTTRIPTLLKWKIRCLSLFPFGKTHTSWASQVLNLRTWLEPTTLAAFKRDAESKFPAATTWLCYRLQMSCVSLLFLDCILVFCCQCLGNSPSKLLESIITRFNLRMAWWRTKEQPRELAWLEPDRLATTNCFKEEKWKPTWFRSVACIALRWKLKEKLLGKMRHVWQIKVECLNSTDLYRM